MRGRTVLPVLVLWVAAMATPLTSVAQQQPIYGCGTAINCRPLGFSTLGPSGSGGVLFGVGIGIGPGFNFHVVAPPTPTPSFEGVRIFRHGETLLPPTPAATPTPTPAPARSSAPAPGRRS